MKGNKKALAWKIVIYIFLVLMAFLYLAPLVWMFFVSLKTNTEIFKSPFALPEEIQLGNFIFAWTAGKLGIATLNSAIVCVTALILNIIIGCMASFALGRLRFKMSGAVMTYFLIGMMIPIHCILIPLFKTFSNMHLYNSLLGLIIPYTVVSLPTTIFIMTGFFKNMPNEMFEAACIDGCSIYKIFTSIALPLSKTGIFVTALMAFVGNWNELLLAMVFISDDAKKTLPVALSKFVGPYNTNYTQMFAAIIIAILPTIIVYCCFSNQIVDGLTAGAVKG
ncbi:carbohydrate ABC transporter permease [Roseburia rectibacter]|jgi:raffinose/stachyose/melibiose transport system permease protein|uniref:carbohydrate ABC transporter permease n=1 Tax=Roseburia TaxID=841 RepID=UPI000E4DC301|nr:MULTISPECIES: carbohydrate ABC transporter permease [Roseburia]RHF97635.1 carbohydrate ABC transporter permease [Roseburia sp. AM23-20]UMY98641.1 carbohydrate ABC transporter permease [Roseburia rectibacter]